MKATFVPDTGDFVWLTFDPQAGREQAGRRRQRWFLVQNHTTSGPVSPWPVPSQTKPKDIRSKWPSRLVPARRGVILADHLKSI